MNHETLTFLFSLKGIGRKTLQKYFYENENIFESSRWEDYISHLNHLRGKELDSSVIEKAKNKAEWILSENEKNNIKQCTIWDKKYPSLLKNIVDPPLLINYKGDIEALNELKSVGIVGTREPTEHGFKVGKRLSYRLSKNRLNIVSGLATGCDTAGHIGALEANGTTSAILAHGLDKVYPKSNKELAQKILATGGVLISEYFVGDKPFANNFVERNRIQVGLSEALIVIETGLEGGTMHTVNFAKKNHRPIYCYNHKSNFENNPKVQGNRKLLKDGIAKPLGSEEELGKLLDQIFNGSKREDPKSDEYAKQGELF